MPQAIALSAGNEEPTPARAKKRALQVQVQALRMLLVRSALRLNQSLTSSVVQRASYRYGHRCKDPLLP